MEMQVLEVNEVKDKTMETWPMDDMKEISSWSKILTHFIKGNIVLSPMETLCLLLENWNTWKV
jgi:phage pi2 protein 07